MGLRYTTGMSRRGLARWVLVGILGFLGTSCSRLYYASMEKLGREKRDILVGRVKGVKQEQEKTKEQFKSTLEAFQEVTGFKGGDLEKVYTKLSGELEDAESRAAKLNDRVDSVEKVAKDLFREWEQELELIQTAALRRESKALLVDTRARYTALLKKMRAAEKRMEPVLAAFRDQVLFLKHNLNARAIQSLKETSVQIDDDVGRLVKDLEASIQEADTFIVSMAS